MIRLTPVCLLKINISIYSRQSGHTSRDVQAELLGFLLNDEIISISVPLCKDRMGELIPGWF
jgi:hypothetical protein